MRKNVTDKKVNIDRKGKYILCISSKKKSVELK